MSEWHQQPVATQPIAPTEPPGATQLPAEPAEPPEASQLPAECPDPPEATQLPAEPRKRRRGPVSLEEQLGVLLDRKGREVEKLRARETALAAELEKVFSARACAESDLVRLLAVRSSD